MSDPPRWTTLLLFACLLAATPPVTAAGFHAESDVGGAFRLRDGSRTVWHFAPPDRARLLLRSSSDSWAGTEHLPLRLLWAGLADRPPVDGTDPVLHVSEDRTELRLHRFVLTDDSSAVETRLVTRRIDDDRYRHDVEMRLRIESDTAWERIRLAPKVVQVAFSRLFAPSSLRPAHPPPFHAMILREKGDGPTPSLPLLHVFPGVTSWRRIDPVPPFYPFEAIRIIEGEHLRYAGREGWSPVLRWRAVPREGLQVSLCWYSLEPHFVLPPTARRGRRPEGELAFRFEVSEEPAPPERPSALAASTNPAVAVPRYREGKNDFSEAARGPGEWTWDRLSPRCRWDREAGDGGALLFACVDETETLCWRARAQSAAYPPNRDLSPHREWTLAGRLRADGFRGRLAIRLLSLGARKEVVKITELRPSTAEGAGRWIPFRGSFRPAPGTWDLRIRIEATGKGELRVDDVGIVELEGGRLEP